MISLLNVPIMIDGRTWGVLEIDTEKRTTFDEADIEFLSTLANIVGNAIARQEAERTSLETTALSAHQNAQAEIALRELQHRTKNNLQIVVGLLAINRRRVEGREAADILDAVIRRVEAVALAHDMLQTGKDTSNVEFAEYLRTLCGSIEPNHRGIEIEVHAVEARMPLNRAVPVALIVNELVTNAIKYAFGNASGTILRPLRNCAPPWRGMYIGPG